MAVLIFALFYSFHLVKFQNSASINPRIFPFKSVLINHLPNIQLQHLYSDVRKTLWTVLWINNCRIHWEISAFYGIRTFTTVSVRDHHMVLFWFFWRCLKSRLSFTFSKLNSRWLRLVQIYFPRKYITYIVHISYCTLQVSVSSTKNTEWVAVRYNFMNVCI
jgi:hypothetical protein